MVTSFSMVIVFNVNPLGLEGLGSTLTSLIRNCSDNKELELCFLCSELTVNDKNNIHQLLQNENFKGTVEFVDFNAKEQFGHLRSLQGDWTTYGRLLIPTFVKTETALYLDADLIIQANILELKDFISDKILSAVFGCTVEWALDHPFLMGKLKWKQGTPYFNAGVILFNLTKWRENNIDKKLKEISSKYPDELLSCDQALLNAICEGEFTHLPKKFNVPWYAGRAMPENAENVILHFVGSPKPWDLFGKIIHNGYSTWSMYNTVFWKKKYGRITPGKIKRAWKIKRSLFKNLRIKLSNQK